MALESNIKKAEKLRGLAIAVPVGATFRERRPMRTELEIAFKKTVVPYQKVLGKCVPMTEPLQQHHLDRLELILQAVEFSNDKNLSDVERECWIQIY